MSDDVVNVSYIELSLRGDGRVRAAMADLKDAVRKDVADINRTAEVKVGGDGGGGLLGELKKTLGRGSEGAQFGALLRGGGAIAAVEMVGQTALKAADGVRVAGKAFAEGKKTLAELADEGIRATPVIGTWAKAIESAQHGMWDLASATAKSAGASKEWVTYLESASTALAKAEDTSKKLEVQSHRMAEAMAFRKKLAQEVEDAEGGDVENAMRAAERKRAATIAESQALNAGTAQQAKKNQADALQAERIYQAEIRKIQSEATEKQQSADEQAAAEAARKLKLRNAPYEAQQEEKRHAQEKADREKKHADEKRKREDEHLLAERKRNAESIADSVKTEQEKRAERLKTINDLNRSGDLSDEDARRAAQAEIDRLAPAKRRVSMEGLESFASSFQTAISNGVNMDKAEQRKRDKLAADNLKADQESAKYLKEMNERQARAATTTRPRV